MKLDEVKVMLGAIRLAVEENDLGAAHGLEDAMRAAVLETIADGTADDPRALAALALTSDDIEFERWWQ